MTVLRSVALLVLDAIAEIGGAWLIGQGGREHRRQLVDRRRDRHPRPVRVRRDPSARRELRPDLLAACGDVFVAAGSLA